MSTTEKGNRLEDELYNYLLEQVASDQAVFGIYYANCCTVRKKPNYHCRDRGADVNFDVVVEVRRQVDAVPHSYLVFECKNHQRPIEDKNVRVFSDQVNSVFGQAAKPLLVISSRLQTGAESVAKNRGIGIVKFDENGIDMIAERAVGSWVENRFIQTQIFADNRKPKTLMFAACINGRYFSSFGHMLRSIELGSTHERVENADQKSNSVAFLSDSKIQDAAQNALALVNYGCGEVDVEKLCRALNLNLSYSERALQDADGNIILGSANFTRKSIEIHKHGNRHRERFTVAHEIGHFILRHDKYLRSESIVEQDLYDEVETDKAFNYERLEYQANLFASMLLLPEAQFRDALTALRSKFETYGRAFGYIFVDDQPCNYLPYNGMLAELSEQFGASKQAIEIKLKRAGLLTDHRSARQRNQSLGHVLGHLGTSITAQ
ncbi:ImmA/IrrE family metallo-endopeptidase [Hoeflea sp. Naph1]|uniref:ImmA/IrrE family metallo-endopeptidase n=1 Tax=Hoeflea sp. Naph1 TaxID=3388653 RepID=UPI00398FC1A3